MRWDGARLQLRKESMQDGTIDKKNQRDEAIGTFKYCTINALAHHFGGTSKGDWETGQEEASHRDSEKSAAFLTTQELQLPPRIGQSGRLTYRTTQISDCSCNVKTLVGRHKIGRHRCDIVSKMKAFCASAQSTKMAFNNDTAPPALLWRLIMSDELSNNGKLFWFVMNLLFRSQKETLGKESIDVSKND